MTTYVERAKVHLSDYRRTHLKVFKDGVSIQYKKPYSHILPQELSKLNLIESYRAEIHRFIEESGIRLHRDFHHLNSSQAACLNLFWPLLNCAEPKLTVEALGIGPDELLGWEFEKVFDSHERTNFDLFLEHKSGAKTFVEFKYTEERFGGAKDDTSHRQKLSEIYCPALRDIVVPEYLEGRKFFTNYQFFRNVTYMNPERGDILILLCPRENKGLGTKIYKVLDEAIQDSTVRSSIKIRYLEDLVSSAQACLIEENGRLHRHVHEFHRKYLAF